MSIPTDFSTRWRQINIPFTSASVAEHHLATDLGPALTAAEDSGLLQKWWFLRKQPWRLRYLPTPTAEPEHAAAAVQKAVRGLRDSGITQFTTTIYEPETHAFGGPASMRAAHTLFHIDSRNIATHLASPTTSSSAHVHHSGRRREMSLLLCTALMRAAGLDRYEQGDVWARIAAHRPQTSTDPQHLTTAVQTLVSVDTAPGTQLRVTGSLAYADEWFTAFERTGRTLRHLANTGELTRGVRAVITHHVLFHWNRIGLPTSDQAGLARAAERMSFADPRTLNPSSDQL